MMGTSGILEMIDVSRQKDGVKDWTMTKTTDRIREEMKKKGKGKERKGTERKGKKE